MPSDVRLSAPRSVKKLLTIINLSSVTPAQSLGQCATWRTDSKGGFAMATLKAAVFVEVIDDH